MHRRGKSSKSEENIISNGELGEAETNFDKSTAEIVKEEKMDDQLDGLIKEEKKDYINKDDKTLNHNNNNDLVNETKKVINSTSDISSDCSSSADLENDNQHENKEKHNEFSDADSAVGSINNVEFLKLEKEELHNNNVDQQFTEGEVVWGGFSKSKFYPCMIYPLNSEDNKDNKDLNDKVLVKYFSWNGLIAYLPKMNVFEFSDMDSFWNEVTEVFKIKREKIKSFSKMTFRAIEEATCFKQIPIETRMKILDHFVELQKTKTPELTLDEQTDIEDDVRDYLKTIIKTMREYDERQIRVKREIKSETKSVKSESSQSSKNSAAQRSSTRVVKKRTFEEYNIDPIIPKQIDEECEPPKQKKPKIVQEESIEERFLSEVRDRNILFRSATKNKVCGKCFVDDDQQTFRCSGKNCTNWYHEGCSEHVESKKDQIRHKTGDSDDIIETESFKKFIKCKACVSNEDVCMICRTEVQTEDPDVKKCKYTECKILYHGRCSKNWHSKNSMCPQHFCHTCSSKKDSKNGNLVKCMMCVATYHSDVLCIPAGTRVISRTQIICPRHISKEEISVMQKKQVKPLNIDWCSACIRSGSLICCDGCPNAFHSECISETYKESDEKFLCDDCLEGRLPLYNTIVWAKVGIYRWWPGFVLYPWVIPLTVEKMRKSEREFCVRFFGSSDFFFTTCERVFPYDSQNECGWTFTKVGASRLNSVFKTALVEAEEMVKMLSEMNSKTSKEKPKFYQKITQNRPVLPVKFKKAEGSEICNCKPTDASPCGDNSDCINLHLNIECSKTCPAGELCQNQMLRDRKGVSLKIIKTKNRGFGAICENDIVTNTFIIEYVGELINQAELNRRMDAKMKKKDREYYFLTVESDLFVDAEFYSNNSRFLNHSCMPNCVTRKITVDGNTRVGIFSNQVIKAGTELTFDYQMVFAGKDKIPCFCEASNCSGLIGEAARKMDDEKKSTESKKKKSSSTKRTRKKRKSITTLTEGLSDPFISMIDSL